MNELLTIRNQVKLEAFDLTKQYEALLKQAKSDYREKMCELFELKNKHYAMMEQIQ